MPKYIELAGSHKTKPSAELVGGIDKGKPISVSVYVKPKKPLAGLSSVYRKIMQITHSHYKTDHSALKYDLNQVIQFAHDAGLSVARVNQVHRVIELRGSISQMESAFKVELSNYRTAKGISFRGRSGPIHIPAELEGIVEGVFGLDNRPVATPKFQVFKGSADMRAKKLATSFNPNQLAELYNFPSGKTGKNQRIAIIELGGGYRANDIANYFTSLGIEAPKVVSVSVDGGINNPTTPDSADGEVMLDIEVAGAVAPNALLAVYFAPNTDKGFLDAINTAIHDTQFGTDIISISWGAPENQWTEQSLNMFNSAFQAAASLGITVCAAAGDSGSSDGAQDGQAHVDFPSSSPFVIACGGTKLIAENGEIQNEIVWHESSTSATGGGVSEVFNLPPYQNKIGVPPSVNSNKKGRGVPDVAAVADPATGYNVLVDGEQFVIGGTSAVAPLMSGLFARINEGRKTNVGFVHGRLYDNLSAFRDINQGDNITVPNGKGYKATSGWDACTGCGVPIGTQLASVLR